jgi:hypothetical protein
MRGDLGGTIAAKDWAELDLEEQQDLWLFYHIALGHPFSSMCNRLWNTILFGAGFDRGRARTKAVARVRELAQMLRQHFRRLIDSAQWIAVSWDYSTDVTDAQVLSVFCHILTAAGAFEKMCIGLVQTIGKKHDAANTFALLRAIFAQNGLKFINSSVSDTDSTMMAIGRFLIPMISERPGFKCLAQWNPCRGHVLMTFIKATPPPARSSTT